MIIRIVYPLTISWATRKFITNFLLGVSVVLLGSCTKHGLFDIQISGSVNHILKGSLIYESTQTGRQLYIQETGPGENIRVLTISFPTQETPTNLPLTTQGPVTASYFEFVDGISRQYWRNVAGNLSLLEAGDPISGVIDFTAFAPDSNESIHVTGTFEGISFQGQSNSFGNFAFVGIILGLILLIGFNFIIQFYVGQRVYTAEGTSILKSLRGTRTFIRGWQKPELRTAMVLWSVVLVSVLLILFLFGAMAVSSR